MSRSLNKVILIGNLTRDPELRYTPQGTAVASFGVATNRQWVTDGEKKEEAEFHNIVVWARLGEIAAQYLSKGRQVYVEGRISTREWETPTGEKRRTTEIVATDIIFLSGGAPAAHEAVDIQQPTKEEAPLTQVTAEGKAAAEAKPEVSQEAAPPQQKTTTKKTKKAADTDTAPEETAKPAADEDDIPF